MENLREKQAQMLLIEAGKSVQSKEIFKTPHEGKIDSKIFKEILKELMDLEDYLYNSRPTHHLTQEDSQLFCHELIAVRNKIDDLLSDFGVIDKQDVEDEIKNLSKKYIILTTKNTFKKVMVRLGADPQRIVVAGVPLELEDMKKINPNLPENALKPIKKKIIHIKNDINRKREQFQIENILVMAEEDIPGEILATRAEEIYNAKTSLTENLKDISPQEFLKILSTN